jgi:DNA-binding NarL/FixJ family response regulator
MLLTPQEAQIAVLARDGLSNPEIVPSCSSVHALLSTTYARCSEKLDISSRRELVRLWPDVPTHSVGEHD